MFVLLSLASLMMSAVHANTEKAIFLGPAKANIPSAHPTLEDLRIDTLTPDNYALRTHLEAQFPVASLPYGKATWLILDDLTEGQRYEVRVCWAATQPTAFRVNTYELQTVFETPELIAELSDYSWSRQPTESDHEVQAESVKTHRAAPGSEGEASVLFLQILAAADYYTMNKTLMRDVPPVYVDIILDPFVFNLLLRSLVPTVGYIVVVTIVTWFLAQRIARGIRQMAIEPHEEKKDQ